MGNEYTHADIIKRLDVLEENLAPIYSTWQSIVALGVGLRIIGRGVLWTAGFVIAVVGAYTALIGGFQ